jgi:tetratricopeptide (TPR) repeat protein
MAASVKKEKRNVIPRWRSFRDTLALGELDAFQQQRPELPAQQIGFAAERIQAWQSRRSVWTAADLVGAALALQEPEQARDAASFLLNAPGAPTPVKRLASKLLDGEQSPTLTEIRDNVEEMDEVSSSIHSTRSLLSAHPQNPIRWVDLARYYTILGLRSRAARAMAVAIGLNSTNRFVLRAASRFYLHYGDPDRAHFLLKNSPPVKQDPWLLAAEIAVAAASDKSPVFVREGRSCLEAGKFRASELTELTSELATLEFTNGKIRGAKKLFKSSLASPNENSLAQAGWVSEHVGLNLNVGAFDIPLKFEAEAWNMFEVSSWEAALKNARLWLLDQPFSSRPATLASYLASSVFQDYGQCIDIVERSLLSNPNDITLLNNLAFALAMNGDAKQAQEILNKVDIESVPEIDRVVLIATQGLIHYRSERIREGRESYLRAVEIAAENGDRIHHAIAMLYLANEEVRAKTPDCTETLEVALKVAQQASEYPTLKVFINRMKAMAGGAGGPGLR